MTAPLAPLGDEEIKAVEAAVGQLVDPGHSGWGPFLPWSADERGRIWADDGDEIVSLGADGKPYFENAATVVKAINALPRLIAQLRAVSAERDASRQAIDLLTREFRGALDQRDALAVRVDELECGIERFAAPIIAAAQAETFDNAALAEQMIVRVLQLFALLPAARLAEKAREK